jgi:hypothetical protein
MERADAVVVHPNAPMTVLGRISSRRTRVCRALLCADPRAVRLLAVAPLGFAPDRGHAHRGGNSRPYDGLRPRLRQCPTQSARTSPGDRLHPSAAPRASIKTPTSPPPTTPTSFHSPPSTPASSTSHEHPDTTLPATVPPTTRHLSAPTSGGVRPRHCPLVAHPKLLGAWMYGAERKLAIGG